MKTFKKAVIVGGKGNEGQRWFRILSKEVERVIVVDKGDSTDQIEDADLVVIALPISSFVTSKPIFDLIQAGVLCLSVMGAMGIEKLRFSDGELLIQFLSSHKIEVAFIHCLCASGMSLGRQNVVMDTRGCSEENKQWVKRLVVNSSDDDINISETSREKHDHLMRFVQVAIRQFAIIFAATAVREKVSLIDIVEHSTPPCRIFLAMTMRLLKQPKDLCRQICGMGGLEFGSNNDKSFTDFNEMFDLAIQFLDNSTQCQRTVSKFAEAAMLLDQYLMDEVLKLKKSDV